jgi:hypothetical protein
MPSTDLGRYWEHQEETWWQASVITSPVEIARDVAERYFTC